MIETDISLTRSEVFTLLASLRLMQQARDGKLSLVNIESDFEKVSNEQIEELIYNRAPRLIGLILNKQTLKPYSLRASFSISLNFSRCPILILQKL